MVLAPAKPATQQEKGFAWLEITPSCQLRCEHCYVSAMPNLGHGSMTVEDWKRVITELYELGTPYIQFIGGEATIHPHFCELLEFAGEMGFHLEVYSNLMSITARMWRLFTRYDVRLATSFYDVECGVHDAITTLPGSQQKTLANIRKALDADLHLRIGMIRVNESQDIERTKAFLADVGVNPERIGVDRTRGVGRGLALIQEDPISSLCGQCIKSRCVITATGQVFPCIMARSFVYGNVRQQALSDILHADRCTAVKQTLGTAFKQRSQRADCPPWDCPPECDPSQFPPCDPDCCPETVASCEPTESGGDDDDDDDDE